jgi:hypothetical protein
LLEKILQNSLGYRRLLNNRLCCQLQKEGEPVAGEEAAEQLLVPGTGDSGAFFCAGKRDMIAKRPW